MKAVILRNPKLKARNTKQYQNSNVQKHRLLSLRAKRSNLTRNDGSFLCRQARGCQSPLGLAMSLTGISVIGRKQPLDSDAS